MDNQPTPERSKCCKAKVRSIVDGTPLGGTGYYQCLACDKPCDLIIPQDTPPSADTSQDQTVKDSLTVTPDNNSTLADRVESHTFLPGISTFPFITPSKQSEECRHSKEIHACLSKSCGHCDECGKHVSTLPKAEGVGEWVEQWRKDAHETYNGGWRDEDTNKAFHHGMDTAFNIVAEYAPNVFRTLLTSATRAVGNIACVTDEDWKELEEINFHHKDEKARFDLLKEYVTSSMKAAQERGRKEVLDAMSYAECVEPGQGDYGKEWFWHLENAVYKKLLPPPPSNQ